MHASLSRKRASLSSFSHADRGKALKQVDASRIFRSNANSRYPAPNQPKKHVATPEAFPKHARLGYGLAASVNEVLYNGVECAAKQVRYMTLQSARRDAANRRKFDHKDGTLGLSSQYYVVERYAYRRLRKCDALSGYVPKYYGQDDKHQILYIERIYGRTLLEYAEICQESSCCSAIHCAGLAHNNINGRNILIRDGIKRHGPSPIDGFVVLINFNLVKFRGEPDKRWTAACNRDLDDLNSTFLAVVGRANNKAAHAMLAQHQPFDVSQEQLAKVVKDTDPDPKPNTAIFKLPRLLPVLALALARAWSKHGRSHISLEILAQFEASAHAPLDSDRRSALLIEGDRVCWSESADKIALFTNVIHRCEAELGPTDPYTLRLRGLYASQLKEHGQELELESVLSSMLQQLQGLDSADKVPKQGDHLFAETLNPQAWITWVEKRMPQASAVAESLEGQ
ncbi:uncharacterized protein BDZ99DRAFT_482436 [Mytilinidion resinicola]|uniref:Protein kinase domain-containing protein n=1 Tax=Mytilinidion resinicola TaxID=574789 RepID=A0A6A6Y223_9PEZI|nr:uncharacterized protein BDZ99DRAFT_482436 [Mytilinidion resinicola]KAF2802866.1 hypothetical protein BDZ99DRAFT_482436 [Mytilinidion resinicola]